MSSLKKLVLLWIIPFMFLVGCNNDDGGDGNNGNGNGNTGDNNGNTYIVNNDGDVSADNNGTSANNDGNQSHPDNHSGNNNGNDDVIVPEVHVVSLQNNWSQSITITVNPGDTQTVSPGGYAEWLYSGSVTISTSVFGYPWSQTWTDDKDHHYIAFQSNGAPDLPDFSQGQ